MSDEEPQKAVKVTVRLFGPLAESYGVSTLEIPLLHGSTILDLAVRLELDTSLEQGTKVALNGVFCSPDEVLPDAAEIAFLPPVSGG